MANPTDAAASFLRHVIETAGISSHRAFVRATQAFSEGLTDAPAYTDECTKIFFAHPELLLGVLPFLPVEAKSLMEEKIQWVFAKQGIRPSDITGQPESNRSHGNKASLYVQQIKEYLGAESLAYSKFYSLLQGFSNKKISFPEAANILAQLFYNHPEHILGFGSFLIPQHQVLATRLSNCLAEALKISANSGFRNQDRLKLASEISELCINFTIPSPKSPTRQIAILACKKFLPPDVELPSLPPLRNGTASDKRRADRSSDVNPSTAPPPGTTARSQRQAAREMLAPSSATYEDYEKYERYGVSYVVRPDTFRPPRCSGRDELGDSVLNDYFVCVPSGREGSFQASQKNPHEETLFRLEDDELELDILVGRTQSTSRTLEFIQENMPKLLDTGSLQIDNIWGESVTVSTPTELIEQSLYPQQVLMLRTICKDRTSIGIDPYHQLRAEPIRYLPEMIARCKFQADEYGRARRGFGLVWRQVFAKHYIKSLDHQSYRFKQEDKKATSPRAILASIRRAYYSALLSGRNPDYHTKFNFQHYNQSTNPPFFHTKNNTFKLEKLRAAQAANGSHDSQSSRSGEKVFQDQATQNIKLLQDILDEPSQHIAPDHIIEQIKLDVIELLFCAGSKILSDTENLELKEWVSSTLMWIMRFPARVSSLGLHGHNINTFYGPKELYVAIKLMHTLHSRLLLGYHLSETFDGTCWDFSSSPLPPKLPNSHLELATMFSETNPQINQFEQSGMASRVTRANASASSTILYWSPPNPNHQIVTQLSHIADTIRTTNISATQTPTKAAEAIQNVIQSEATSTTETTTSVDQPPQDSTPDLDQIYQMQLALQPLPDPILKTPNDQKYQTFVETVKSHLKGKMDQSSFEDSLMKLLGPEGYPLYTIQRVLATTILQLRTMMTLPGREVWYEALANYTKNMDTLDFVDPHQFNKSRKMKQKYLQEYRQAAIEAANGEKFFQFEMTTFGDMYVTLISAHPEAIVSSASDTWKRYIKSFIQEPIVGMTLTHHPCFLARNIKSRLPKRFSREDLISYPPSWQLTQSLEQLSKDVSLNLGILAAISLDTRELTFVCSTTDSYIRKGRRSESTSRRISAVNQGKESKIDNICARLYQETSQPKEAPSRTEYSEALHTFLGELLKREYDRADAMEPMEVEYPAARTRQRATRSKSAGDDDENNDNEDERNDENNDNEDERNDENNEDERHEENMDAGPNEDDQEDSGDEEHQAEDEEDEDNTSKRMEWE